jgi:hypothetical protein
MTLISDDPQQFDPTDRKPKNRFTPWQFRPSD